LIFVNLKGLPKDWSIKRPDHQEQNAIMSIFYSVALSVVLAAL
jgi:hypothetical protein